MLFQPKAASHLERLEHRIERAHVVTPQLMKAMIIATEASARANPMALRCIGQLIEAGAWTDAALSLIDIAMPPWRLRRIVHDAGVWHCSLSRHPQLADWLDQTADGRHDVLPLAILCSLIEARRVGLDRDPPKRAQPAGTIKEQAVCCDNFS